MAFSLNLPIDPHLKEIISALETHTAVIVEATPGSGKTTRVPPAMLAAKFCEGKEIWVLEPRRLAAKYAAIRVAEEAGEQVGQTIGYHFRFEKKTSSSTRLLFLTEGMLMRRLLKDPTLARVGAVVLDEFHERSLHSEIALAYLRKLQTTSRQDLRLVVMSATLDSSRVQIYFENCPLVQVKAPVHPVEIQNLAAPGSKPLENAVKEAVTIALRSPYPGDILVFLPGMGEIRRAESLLRQTHSQCLILPLHGELSREEQDKVFKKAEKRKIILSTNVAETSLTIDGVTTVIDSGLYRQAQFSWWSGVPSLKTRNTSRASAIQRAGRAGRTAPGLCLRLYSKHEFDGREPYEKPEILRADLTQTVLELKNLKIANPKDLPWYETPPTAALDAGLNLLHRLGAIDSPTWESTLTERGKKLVEVPAHPRLGRFLIEAQEQGILSPAALLCALISEGALDSIDAMDCVDRPSRYEGLRRAVQQYLSAVDSDAVFPRNSLSASEKEKLARAVLTGFPDRVAGKREKARGKPGEIELLFSSGGTAKAENAGPLIHHDYFVVLDVLEQKHLNQARSDRRVRSLIAIEPEWLFDLTPTGLKEENRAEWDSERKQIRLYETLAYDDLILSQSEAKLKPSKETLRVLLKEGFGIDSDLPDRNQFLEALTRLIDSDEFLHWNDRISFLEKQMPEAGLPGWVKIWETLASEISNHASLSPLKGIDWISIASAALPNSILGKLENWAPSSIKLPNGRRAKIHYPSDKSPWTESRLQDFFGMKAVPTLLDGRVKLTIHFLAPNYRAVQVTTDLAGFWEREYPRLRKELGRRYPRHAWPEDTSKPLPPKK